MSYGYFVTVKRVTIPRILVVSAMSDEVKYLVGKSVDGAIVDVLVTKEGKINAAKELTKSLMREKYSCVINIGTCAGVARRNVLDMVVGKIVSSIDVDYVGGKFKTFFDNDFVFDGALPAFMMSNDKFLTNKYYHEVVSKRQIETDLAITYDMESFAYASVCDDFGVPFVDVRCVTDVPCGMSYVMFKKNLDEACKKISNYVLKLIPIIVGKLI